MRFILYLLLLVVPPALADQTADFIAAHDAFLAGDAVKLGRYAQRLKKTPLEVYVSYYQLSLNLKNAGAYHVFSSPEISKGKEPVLMKQPGIRPDYQKKIPGLPALGAIKKAVKDFLSRPGDTPIIDQLRVAWLKLLGKEQQWDMFDVEYPRLLNEDTELICYSLQSRRHSQELAALREARKLWFTGKELPDSCGTLFEAALSVGIINEQDVRQRLRLALEENNLSLALKLVEQPYGKYANLPTLLKSAAADPDGYLKKLKPDDFNSTNSSNATTTQALTSTVIEAQVSGIEQPPPSNAGLEITRRSPDTAAPSPSANRPGWRNILSRLGFGKTGNPPSVVTDSASPPPPAQDARLSGDLGTGCEAPCVVPGKANAAPAIGLNSKVANESERAIALFALQRLARQSPELAEARWVKISGYFPATEQRYFYGRLAYEAARNLDARALRWYKAAADTPLDDRQSAWRVRAALRMQDWPEVLASVNAMSEQQQRESAWQYWKARALQALGKPIEAREIFAPLSGEFNFYGQLANEELTDLPVLSEAIPAYKPDKQSIAKMLALPGVRRTLALYRMNMRNEALEEWRWVLRNFNDRELLTAAEIAKRNEMYDRAIGAAVKTVHLHDFSLRYLAPYRAELQEHIREHGLDEAWVYGLMRQESRFSTGAKSQVGASGLMQIMPATARWVAKKLGLKSYRNELIHQLDTNLRLGTYYMKTVLSQSENNPVLASAAYNAGPNRALQWRGDQPLEGAIFAETIPFEETREYVKKVMSNTVYYADQFGDSPQSLKQRLGIIAAKTANNQRAAPDVP